MLNNRSITSFARDGKVRSPRWTLEECLDYCGQNIQKYHWFVKKYPGAPEPVSTKKYATSSGRQNLYEKHKMIKYLKFCIEQEKSIDIEELLLPFFNAGWDQSQIAEASGIQRSGLNRYLSGKMGMTKESRDALLNFVEKYKDHELRASKPNP